MARYRFHCTNGLECVVDTVGKDIRLPDRLPAKARGVAEALMVTLDGQTDWAEWQVSVHDLKGRKVLALPFRPPGDHLRQDI
ncbi:hypothetical protein MKK68_28660 [Methylobacterium sp. E-016]|uniref:DUF6894 family protein n=1 Tax=Methylobacterium sp. E-016 TaxID=2836556 RepID=UPI001FB95717|nr:hypothetical protein [Methylobacterium sp. E-016]MCJ2079556.1 hypothetical protein [Methylobacterium sp. E-016]